MNSPIAEDFKIVGTGTFALPEGMTQEEADRLAREADQERETWPSDT